MKSDEAILEIVKKSQGNSVYISSLGRTSELLFRISPNNTLFVDSMGDVTSLAIGVAISFPHTSVYSFDTDGSFLMGMTVVQFLADYRDRLNNLHVIIFDNGVYESGGGLKSRKTDFDWELFGLSWNLKIEIIKSMEELKCKLNSKDNSIRILVLSIDTVQDVVKLTKTIDGVESKYRFIRHLEEIGKTKILSPSVKA